MSYFENELSQGNFMISHCPSCKNVVWPPSDYCNRCLSKVIWKNSDGLGKIIEFSKKDDDFFCLAEFEGKVRIMGKLIIKSGLPQIGKNVRIDSCRVEDKNYIFTMKFD